MMLIRDSNCYIVAISAMVFPNNSAAKTLVGVFKKVNTKIAVTQIEIIAVINPFLTLALFMFISPYLTF